ncbi:hypothetical protein CXB51_030476 [Gossypium anomalum]|uniref:BZIP domain-containing protein n=1 Tax=Gossypium anomalum TaxID=47600 RepID=A0A8J5YX60_9ROSI|nr:hypothetical protein CXB51_030476 [Gossypium anomalum]
MGSANIDGPTQPPTVPSLIYGGLYTCLFQRHVFGDVDVAFPLALPLFFLLPHPPPPPPPAFLSYSPQILKEKNPDLFHQEKEESRVSDFKLTERGEPTSIKGFTFGALTMGNNDEGKSSKSDKSSSPVPTDQNNIHVYPDWAAMQAYYGPRVNMPPYYSSAVASGHAPPPYMWGPTQPMMPPYGAPYATIYSHGEFMHIPQFLWQASHSVGVPSSPAVLWRQLQSPPRIETRFNEKLKGFDGLAISIGNGTAENAEEELNLDHPIGEDEKIEAKSSQVAVGEVTATISPKPIGTVVSPGMTTGTILELRNTPTKNAMSSAMGGHCGVMPTEVWLQNEQELKRERRKQSNRESARRSRLRKQAETEELARKVESLTSANAALRSEINQLTEMSEKVRLENAILVEDKEGEMCEKKSDSGAKLHQLLDPSPRDDAVAAG